MALHKCVNLTFSVHFLILYKRDRTDMTFIDYEYFSTRKPLFSIWRQYRVCGVNLFFMAQTYNLKQTLMVA